VPTSAVRHEGGNGDNSEGRLRDDVKRRQSVEGLDDRVYRAGAYQTGINGCVCGSDEYMDEPTNLAVYGLV